MKILTFIKYGLISLLWLFPNISTAEGNHIYTGAWSYHYLKDLKYKKQYNETNYLVGIQHENLFIGTFNNSYEQQTYIAGLYYPLFFEGEVVEISAAVGGSYGYKQCYGAGKSTDKAKFCGLILPEITINLGVIKPTIILIGTDVLVLSFKWKY